MTHVLIVEDHEENRNLLKMLLEVNGYRVTAAGDGLEALAAARRDLPDAIVSDVLMPKMDGFALCRAWMQDVALKPIPFIFYSATYVQPEDEQFAVALGAVCYLIKPLEAEVFLGELRAVLQQWAGQDAPIAAAPLDELTSHALHESALARKLEDKIAQLEAANCRLQENEARFRAIASHAPDHILMQDRDLRYIFVVNPQLGLTEADMIGKTDRDLVGKEDAEKLTAIKRKVLETGESVQLETSLQNSKGMTEFFEGVYTPKFDPTGKADGLIGYFRNITERKRAEDALRNRENLLQRIFEILPVGLWYADKDGKLLRGNPAGVKIWGAEPKVSLSESGIFKARRLPSGEEVTPDDWALAHSIRDKVTIVDELLEIDAFDGNKKTILNYTAPVLDAQGEVQGAIVVNQDITERKRAEDALRRSSKRMRDLSQRLIEVEDGVRRKINRELHDRVGASLSALNLNLSIVRSQLPRESLRAVGARLDDTQRLLEETTAHVRDLMADLHPPALDDYGLFAALRTYVDSLGGHDLASISIHGEAFVPRLPLAAETALFRVAQGALVNAVTHARAKRIEVILAATTDLVALTIADDGIGFNVAHPSETHASWGLAIMRERSEAVGAELTLKSTPGRGTRVCVEISREKR